MLGKSGKIKTIFFVYWFLLLYILSALVWWYIALSRQNEDLFRHRVTELSPVTTNYQESLHQLKLKKNAKRGQYMGEGIIFFLLIGAGAIFLYRAVDKQLKLSEQQKNFMMAVTHELKTPIAVTKLNLETMQKRKLDESQQQRLLQHALDETNRMNSLCNNLLLSSQMESGKYAITLERVSINEAIQEIIRDFNNRFPERTVISKQVEAVHILTDIFLFQILIHNILHNAHKYAPKEQPIEVMIQPKHRQVVISIKDEGKGIPKAEHMHVFEKFYRSDATGNKQVKGTGLGLYIAKRITALLKADISLEENIPSGCIFSICFTLDQSYVA